MKSMRRNIVLIAVRSNKNLHKMLGKIKIGNWFCWLMIIALFSSCSLTKRKYMPGYYVELHRKEGRVNSNKIAESRSYRHVSSGQVKGISSSKLFEKDDVTTGIIPRVWEADKSPVRVKLRLFKIVVKPTYFPREGTDPVQPEPQKRLNAGIGLLYGAATLVSAMAEVLFLAIFLFSLVYNVPEIWGLLVLIVFTFLLTLMFFYFTMKKVDQVRTTSDATTM